MSGREETLALRRRLVAQLRPLAVGVALLIGIVPPLTWYRLRVNGLERTATLYARELTDRFQGLILPSPALWKYQVQKYGRLLSDFLPDKSVVAIRILDDQGRSITQYQHGREEGGWRAARVHLGSAPLVFNDRRIGTIEVSVADPSLLRDALGVFAFSLAVGLALATALYRVPVQAVAEMERQIRELVALRRQLLDRIVSAQEEERRRLARELHDQAGQSLTSLLLALQSLEAAAGADTVRAKLRELRSQVAGILGDLQRVVRDLRPSLLDDLGLVAAIEEYARACTLATGLRIDVVAQGLEGVRLAPGTELALYRAVQEGLTNVVKHARARHVSVVLERRGADLVAVVEDDGQGFSPRKTASGRSAGGLGLLGIAERAALLGGASVVESKPGAGTTLVVTIPAVAGE